MKLSFVIELDDATHPQLNRQKRDLFVQTVLSNAEIKLIRINDDKISDQEILKLIKQSFE